MSFIARYDKGNCLVCKALLAAGQPIERVKVTKSRNVYAFKHASADHCKNKRLIQTAA